MTGKRRILVTGAGGFIGSHLVEALLEQGFLVRAFVRYTSHAGTGWLKEIPSRWKSHWEPFFGDIRDARLVGEAVRDCWGVYHLAALIGIPYSSIAPTSYINVNVEGTLNVLEAARASTMERVIITSTSEVYGTARFTPITEQHPLQPQSPYAASKIGADSLALSYHHSFGLPVTIVRPFNTYGPRQSSRAILPTIIHQALASDAIRVGNRLPIRDLVHVKDTVAGFLAIGNSKKCIGQIINLASAVGVQVEELIHLVTAQVGRHLPILEEESRKRPESSEVHRLIGSAEKAAELVGWLPRISLDEGLAQTISWFRGRHDTCDPASYRV